MRAREESSGYVPLEGPPATKDGDLERWEIAPGGSSLRFVLRHIVVHQIRGRFSRWGGTLFLNRADPSLSSVHAWVDLASVDTESAERDDHVRSPEFFDVARFPLAEFDSSSSELGPDHVLLRGRLSLHGVRHDLEVQVGSRSGPTDGARNSYPFKGTLNRQSFGLHWNQDLPAGGIVVGDEIAIEGEVELVRGDAQPGLS